MLIPQNKFLLNLRMHLFFRKTVSTKLGAVIPEVNIDPTFDQEDDNHGLVIVTTLQTYHLYSTLKRRFNVEYTRCVRREALDLSFDFFILHGNQANWEAFCEVILKLCEVILKASIVNNGFVLLWELYLKMHSNTFVIHDSYSFKS